jgi:hypothetical protein
LISLNKKQENPIPYDNYFTEVELNLERLDNLGELRKIEIKTEKYFHNQAFTNIAYSKNKIYLSEISGNILILDKDFRRLKTIYPDIQKPIINTLITNNGQLLIYYSNSSIILHDLEKSEILTQSKLPNSFNSKNEMTYLEGKFDLISYKDEEGNYLIFSLGKSKILKIFKIGGDHISTENSMYVLIDNTLGQYKFVNLVNIK